MRPTFPDQNVQGLTISPSRAVAYQVPSHWIISGRRSKSTKQPKPPPSIEEKQRKNRARVIGRYWQAVGWLWIRSRNVQVNYGKGKCMKFRQGFLTLTIPGVSTGDHKAIKNKILDPFFTYCRNRLGLRDYVWTAEIQPSTGEIHFHAIVNTFMDKARIRDAWNRQCERSGLITMSQGKRPSTEIEKCKSYNGSKAYAAKYLGKALQSGEIVGRVWSGSHGVTGPSAISTNEIEADYDLHKAINELNNNGHQWDTLDHEVRVTRLQTQAITKRRYPYVWRLLMAQLRDYDEQGTRSVQQPPRMADRSRMAPADRVGGYSAVSHPPVGHSLSQHRDRVGTESGIVLQAGRMGADQGAFWDVLAHVQGGHEGRDRSCPF